MDVSKYANIEQEIGVPSNAGGKRPRNAVRLTETLANSPP